MKFARQLRLDRMTIEEAGPDPRLLAAAIHAQLPDLQGPVPVHEIARALDIVAIREERTKGFEAALVAPEERGEGVIVVNAKSPWQRQRYSIGHELCHFINPAHRPTALVGQFACTSTDLMASSSISGNSPNIKALHARQETEANRFAIELLAPARLVGPYLDDASNLRSIIAMADCLDISREASARRYVELHRQDVAVVFSKDGKVRYVAYGPRCPLAALWAGCGVDVVPRREGLSGLSNGIAAEPGKWFGHPIPESLIIQTFHQQDGYAMTLLAPGRFAGIRRTARSMVLQIPASR